MGKTFGKNLKLLLCVMRHEILSVSACCIAFIHIVFNTAATVHVVGSDIIGKAVQS